MIARAVRAGWVGVAAVALAGCNPYASLQGGYFNSLSASGVAPGAALDLRLGMHGAEPRRAGLGGGFGLRTKFSSDLVQFALVEELFALPFGDGWGLVPFLRAGLHGFQFESYRGSFAFGMYSPYGELGFFVPLHDSVDQTRTVLAVALAGEYAVRFTDQPNEGYWALTLGIGALGRARPIHPRPQPRPTQPVMQVAQ